MASSIRDLTEHGGLSGLGDLTVLRLDYGRQASQGCAFSIVSLLFIHVTGSKIYQMNAEYPSYSVVYVS